MTEKKSEAKVDAEKASQVGAYTAAHQGWLVKQYEATVPARIAERFAEWMHFMSDKVVPGKPIELTLSKPNGGRYSDSTFHTQVNTVLHDDTLCARYPEFADYRVRYLGKKTTFYITKDHRPTE
jgi:hypothetical protein